MEKGGKTEENSFGEFYFIASLLSSADSDFFILLHVEVGARNACDGRACCSLMSIYVSYFHFNNIVRVHIDPFKEYILYMCRV